MSEEAPVEAAAAAAAPEPTAAEAEAEEEGEMTEERVVGIVKELRQEQAQLVTRIGELEAELSEHRVVCDAMRKVEPARRCYRLVGGVLVERTAGEVLPAVEQSRDGIEQALFELQRRLADKTKRLDAFMREHKVRFVSEEEAQSVAAQEQLALLQQQQQRQQQEGREEAGVEEDEEKRKKGKRPAEQQHQ